MIKDEITLTCIKGDEAELYNATESVLRMCDIVENMQPGEVSKTELNINNLHRFSVAGDVFYSKCGTDGHKFAELIFETFKKLANLLVIGEVDESALIALRDGHINTLKDILNKSVKSRKTA